MSWRAQHGPGSACFLREGGPVFYETVVAVCERVFAFGSPVCLCAPTAIVTIGS